VFFLTQSMLADRQGERERELARLALGRSLRRQRRLERPRRARTTSDAADWNLLAFSHRRYGVDALGR
jgi:hypothetical protein